MLCSVIHVDRNLSPLSIYGSLSIRKLRGNLGLIYIAVTSQKTLAKLVFQIGHFDPNSFAHFLYSTIMWVAKWEQYLWWLSCFSESENWVRLWPFSYWKTHMHTKLKINKSIVIDVLHRLMIKNNWLSDKSTFYVMSCLSLDLEYFLYRMRYLGLLRSQDLHWSWQPARMWNILTTPNASNQWIIMIGLRP